MSFLADLKMYGRFAWGLPSFLRHTMSLEEARTLVQHRMVERETNFLRLVERGIFGYARSPYLPLLKLAGCTLEDIRQMVRTQGLEDTLRALREAGVYVTFEEFKGRAPIVRHGQVFPVPAQDFDNPYLSHYYQAETGGSTGAGTRVGVDLSHLAALAPCLMLTWDAHNVLGVPTALWRGVLPDGSGLNNILYTSRFGQVPQKWFSHIATRDWRHPLRYHLATYGTVIIGRLWGAAIPWPETVPVDQAHVVARWAAETLQAHGACLILTQVSRALRVCLAAQEAGRDLDGATFVVGGEPTTPAKMQAITHTGARCFPTYTLVEAGRLGVGCSKPVDEGDLHFLKDAFALVQYPHQIPGSDYTVPAFHLTSLLSTTPKLMLNVETDDYGVLETRACGCPLEAYGFTEHLRHIRSFQKLTGEGVTLVGSDMVHILEAVLPARFGGSPLDYQLLEEEDEQGFTRLSLVVSPKVALPEETVVIAAVLEALSQGSIAADSAQAVWNQARTLRVKRMEPIWTARGKLMPLHLAQRAARAHEAEQHPRET
jgi:hypothetical protein